MARLDIYKAIVPLAGPEIQALAMLEVIEDFVGPGRGYSRDRTHSHLPISGAAWRLLNEKYKSVLSSRGVSNLQTGTEG